MFRIVITYAAFLSICVLVSSSNAQTAAKVGSEELSFGIVIDNSGSYRTLLERIITFSRKLTEQSKEGDEAFLLTFVDAPRIKLRQEFTSNMDEVAEALDNMFVEGGNSAVLDAVRFSIDYLTANAKSRNDRQSAILLVSDGDDTASSAKIDTVLTAATAAGIRIVVVGISDEKVNTKLLDRLAKGSGGKAFYPKTPKELTESVPNIASALKGK